MTNVKKTYKLFLDDIREPKHAFAYTRFGMFLNDDWVVVRTYNEFITYIKTGWEKYSAFPEIVAFDHDLAEEHYGADVKSAFNEKTGMDCAQWLIDFCIDNNLKLPRWYCHSMNPAGRDNINYLLRNFKQHQNE
jgi:hypothetical protein